MKTFNKLMLATSAICTIGGAALAEGQTKLPLVEFPGIEDRDYWIPGEVNAEGKLEAMQAVVGADAVPFSGSQEGPIQIALIYPSADTSDFWTSAWP